MKRDDLINNTKLQISRIGNILYDAKPWIVLSVTVLSTSLASNAIQKLLEEFVFKIDTALKPEEIYPNILYIVTFIGSITWLYTLRSHLFRARTQGMKNVETPEQREHLILFLSNIDSRQLNNYNERLIPSGLILENSGLQSLDNDLLLIEKYKENNRMFWSWEMTFRTIRHHIGDINSPTLKSITVMCSPESIEQLPQFGEIVKNYIQHTEITFKVLAKKKSAHYWGTWNNSSTNQQITGYDFEDFDELTSALHWYVKQRLINKVKEKEMVIDFTGGMKVTSVVAATLTFNSNIKAQYISTKTSQIKGYDVIYGTSNLPSIG